MAGREGYLYWPEEKLIWVSGAPKVVLTILNQESGTNRRP
jgi:hypothetical protein